MAGWVWLVRRRRELEAVAFALGLYAIAALVGRRLPRPDVSGRGSGVDVVMAALVGVVAIGAIWTYPAYAARSDFWFERRVAERNFADAALVSMYEWLRRETSPSDVVLAPLNTGQYVVGAAGRKVVAVDKLFSNPYVDWGERAIYRAERRRHRFCRWRGRKGSGLSIASDADRPASPPALRPELTPRRSRRTA